MVMLARTWPCASTISSERPRSTGATSWAPARGAWARENASTATLTALRAMRSRSRFIVPPDGGFTTQRGLRVGCLRADPGSKGGPSASGARGDPLDWVPARPGVWASRGMVGVARRPDAYALVASQMSVLPPLELHCFGVPAARLAGGPAPPEVLRRKHLALLVYLALSPKRRRTRAHL